MVKIKDLSNPQIVQQLKKYQKIIDELVKERSKRIDDGQPKKELFTTQELSRIQEEAAPVAKAAPAPAPVKKAAPAPVEEAAEEPTATPAQEVGDDGAFQVSFDDGELDEFKENMAKEKEKEEENDEQIRVTQLLTLSKEDLAELQANKKKSESKAKKAKK